jgi:hypothetical protein
LITQLIKPLGSVPAFTEPDTTVPIEPQLPSIIAISRELVLASNGVGDIELIGIEEKNGKMLGTSLASVCYLGTGKEGISPVPCMLLAARQVKNKIILVVYSHTASKNTEFNIAALEMDIPTQDTERLEDGSFVLLLKSLHSQTGPEVPVYCSITPSGKRLILGSGARYNKVHLEEETMDQAPMDIVEEEKEEKKPAYQWTQEGADITVLFNLPAETPKSAINCKFVVDHLSLLIEQANISYPYRKLWSTVRPDECVWTFDSKSGLLSLFLTKMDENTRWPQLFDHDDGVLETLSPTVLKEINNRMEKFTASAAQVEEEENSMTAVQQSFVPQPSQHPAATDMDEEIDEAGQPVVFSIYDMDSGNVVEEFSSGAYSWICKSYDNGHDLPSVCLSMDVDGLVFSFTEENDYKIKISHDATFDAFSFVQASKRDARYVRHDPHYSFTSIIESSRNAYIYFHHDDKRIHEVQTLIDLTQGHNVDVIGAQLVLENTLMILTESQIIIIELPFTE